MNLAGKSLLDIINLKIQIGVFLRNPWFKPTVLPFSTESFICRNISDSSSQSIFKLITQVKSLIFKITKIVPGSVPGADNES